MRKPLLLSALLLACAYGANAQLTVHNFQSETWADTEYGDEYDAMGEFHHVSANGQFAVGCDDQEQSASQGGAFLWKRSEPTQIEFINKTLNRISAQDVTNDGMIVGSFEEREDPETQVMSYPGYRTNDCKWNQLPVPESYSSYYAKWFDFMDEARAVTPEGKYIAGNVYLTMGSKYIAAQGKSEEIVYLTPVLWELTDDGYILKQAYTGLGDKGMSYVYNDGALENVADTVNYKTFLVWDISNDGNTIVGVNTADCGAQNPAFIRDGKLIQLFNCDNDRDEEGNAQNFNGGICNSIDANGNIYGYFVDGNNYQKNFVFTSDDKLVYYDNKVVCAAKDGTLFESSSNGVAYVLDCSEDGQVVVGAGVGAWEMGTYSYPMLASNDTSTGIDRVKAIRSNVSIDYRAGGSLFVNGEYNDATIYNAAGARIMGGKQGTKFDMNALPTGTYIVKVNTATGDKTFKVVR